MLRTQFPGMNSGGESCVTSVNNGGQNILGHTAPYPKAIPGLLLDLVEPRSTISDPYSGSMTTARTAYKRGIRSINIDYKEEYCKLGISLLVEQEMDLLNGVGQGD